MKALRTWLVVVGWVVAACGGASSGSSNSETHFLGLCTGDDCGDGLSCICGVCTVTCDPAASCGALNPNAICTSSDASSCGDDTQPSVCDVDCEDDRECASLGSDYRCQVGVCRLPGCVYEGRVYAEGATFDAPNSDCNTCTCGADGEVACTRAACPESCEYDGESHELGDEFPATDGCNSCTCTSDGVACTDAACTNTCEYGGTIYQVGDNFPASDGCNGCGCTEDGIVCTTIACNEPTCTYDGVTYQVGDVIMRDCGACTCTDAGTLACDDGTCEGCQVGDRFYDYGDSYLAEDGCNVCTCAEDGGGCTQRACMTPECLLPFAVGSCDAAFQVFYYNPNTFRCEERIYGGCDGNANNFATLEACQQHCTEIDNGD